MPPGWRINQLKQYFILKQLVNQANFLVPTPGNDPRSSDYQSGALPLSYAGILITYASYAARPGVLDEPQRFHAVTCCVHPLAAYLPLLCSTFFILFSALKHYFKAI